LFYLAFLATFGFDNRNLVPKWVPQKSRSALYNRGAFDAKWPMFNYRSLENYTRLLNDAANSPLVENAGSKNQFWLGLGVAYWF